MALITLAQVKKRLQKHQVLHDMSFAVREGEILGLLGPNGSGKTTTIRCINGVLTADAGEITVAGRHPYRDGDAVRRLTGVLTETAGFYPHMTALENLRFYSRLHGLKDDRRALQLLEEFGLGAARDRKTGAFSTGMKKRLGLARALLHDPQILFLDEPTNGLDPEGIQQVSQEIVRLNQQGKTIVICSHVLQQLESICHRYVFMAAGRVIEQGTKAELEQRYLTNLTLQVETDAAWAGAEAAGLPATVAAPGRVEFRLRAREAVPALLRRLSAEMNIYSAALAGQDLQALYFKVLEGTTR
ncbi:MAG: transporter ATP-binding protein [Symbiobacteriaceae bacterium]|jgi:ABC-2 type transport system ATP-binding protein|nr:transporter ATP-binding protein [Symbiobacteriaceae bacterium]